MKNFIKRIFAIVLIRLGLVKRAIKKIHTGQAILSIYFHNPSKKEFEEMVKWLLKNNISFLSLDELNTCINNKSHLPKSKAIITLDDGWASNKDNVVAIAEKYKIPIAIFITTKAIEDGYYWWTNFNNSKEVENLKTVANEKRLAYLKEINFVNREREALTIDQLKLIAKSTYITIGSHTHTHPILTQCSHAETLCEISESKKTLETWIQKPINYFAYPNGDYSKREIELLNEHNYKLAFTVKQNYLLKDDFLKTFEIPRLAFVEGASFEENLCRISGVWPVFSK